MYRLILWLSATATLLPGCVEHPPVAPDLTTQVPVQSATKKWESNAAIYWTDVARALTASTNFNAFQAIRGYSIVALAQYNAAVAAEDGKIRNAHPSVHAAISSASVVALSYLFPAQAANLELQLSAYLAEEGWPGERNGDVAGGETIGRAVGTQVVDRAKTDRFFDPVTVTVPTGPGKWFSATPPAGAGFGLAKTYFLETSSQFRPAPHPVFEKLGLKP